MIVQRENEPRIEYPAMVLHWMMYNSIAGEALAEYAETTCDGLCLAQELMAELGMDEDDL